MDFLSYREIGHIGGPSGKGHIRALDIGGNTPISGNITCMHTEQCAVIKYVERVGKTLQTLRNS